MDYLTNRKKSSTNHSALAKTFSRHDTISAMLSIAPSMQWLRGSDGYCLSWQLELVKHIRHFRLSIDC